MPSTKIGYTVSSVELLAVTVTFVAVVAVSALPVTSPVRSPTNVVAVAIPATFTPVSYTHLTLPTKA